MRIFIHLFIFFVVFISLGQTTYADKPSPISNVLPTPTPITIEKGIFEPTGSSSSTEEHESYKLKTVVQLDSAVPYELCEGAIIEPGSEGIQCVDPEFAATYNSVMFQEHGWMSGEREPVLVAGKYYRVLSCMQIMIDDSTLPLLNGHNWTPEDIRDDCSKAVVIAHEIWSDTHSWYRWVAKPQYRTNNIEP